MVHSHRPLIVVLMILALLITYGTVNATGPNPPVDPPLQMQADEPPGNPDDPDDPEEGVWCTDPFNWPGVVRNRSGGWMKIKGDLVDGGDEQTYWLADGEDSDEDTNMCDVDYFTVTHSDFYLQAPYIEYDANEWTDYIYFSTWLCEPDGDRVRCTQQ